MAAAVEQGHRPLRKKKTRRKVDGFWMDGTFYRYVDGFRIRNDFPDFDLVESHWTSGDLKDGIQTPYIPEGEVWIDRRFRKETKFLLKVHRTEQRLKRWPYKKVRAYLNRDLPKKKPKPSKYTVRTERHGRWLYRFVRGEIIRQCFDRAFIFGGNPAVYDYVPKGEIWIDARQDPREMPYTIVHELHEHRLMTRKGLDYDAAHRLATEKEKKMRQRELKVRRKMPLKMKPFLQTAGLCGPAGLKIIADYFGREYEEQEMARLCGSTPETGTDHAPLVEGAKAIGASARGFANGTIAELRHFVLKKRLPVLVGWWAGPHRTLAEIHRDPDKDEGHYSVVYHLTDKHVYLMDPDLKRGRRRMAIRKFLEKWYDTDGPYERCRRVDRWYLVMNFDGKPIPRP